MESSSSMLLFQCLLVIITYLDHAFSLASENGSSLPGCKGNCGGIEIMYPFGIGDGCFAPGFEITCREEIPYLDGTDIQLLELLPGEARVNSTHLILTNCPSLPGNRYNSMFGTSVILPKNGPYTFLAGSNKLVVVGCEVEATVIDDNSQERQCKSHCPATESVSDGTCSGNGCCQIPILTAAKALNVVVDEVDSFSFYPVVKLCRYALLVEDGRYNFSEVDLHDSGRLTNISMKLEWALEGDCDMADGSTSNLCGENSSCVPSNRGSGHLCECSPWHDGNPYLNGSQGCHGVSQSHCEQKCGSININYPFGIGKDCFFPGFEVICNNSIPYLADLNLQLLEIMNGEIRVNSTSFMAIDCPWATKHKNSISVEFPSERPFMISVSNNTFTVIGCDAEGTIRDDNSAPKMCHSDCLHRASATNDSYTGNGYCRTSLPLLQRSFEIGVKNLNVTRIGNCSYGFLAEEGSYKFKENDLLDFYKTADTVAKLDWTIIDSSCKEASQSLSSICGNNTECIDSPREIGYLCSCLSGFEGNPYKSEGCHDINECEAENNTSCPPGAYCKNKIGGYACVCSKGLKMGESGCEKSLSVIPGVLASTMSAAFMMVCVSWCHWAYKKRKLIQLRSYYFQRNGGLLFQQHFSPAKGVSIKHTKIFSVEELQKATDNYKCSKILGHGGHGTVYEGILKDGTKIAIKKSQIVAKDQLDLFINELIILAQINHRNIVKLLGCCLETEIPLLVYEYIPNGSLYDNLHGESETSTWLPWKHRVHIAMEIAEALCYLHSDASVPVFHRDVKSSNILLDANYTARLADFGLSRLVPIDKWQVDTAVQGTIGYLDPEYFSTGKLTEKSDVYSFGVVLLELLTGQKPFLHDGARDYSCLVMHFCQNADFGSIEEVIDKRIFEEGKVQEVERVANIARLCLNMRGEERPKMSKVKLNLASLLT